MPQLGNVMSKVLPYKIAGMILVALLSMTVSFTFDTLFPIISLHLNKVKSPIFSTAMDTLIVICQRQSLDTLQIKSIRKLIYSIAEASVDIFNREICNFSPNQSRNSSSKIRHRSILIFEQLFDRIGDSLAFYP